MPTPASHSPKNHPGVLIACGGTGGHLFPGIAVAEQLVQRGHEVILLISEKQIDALASRGYDYLRFGQLPSLAMPKPWSPKMVPFLSRFAKGMALSRKLIREIDAKAVLSMGGFTSTAPLMAARSAGCRGYIHESNAISRRANRLNVKFAGRALVGWDACASHFPEEKVRVVGTPVRPRCLKLPDKAEARDRFGLSPDKFTLLVMGGSQGARGINKAACDMLQYFDADLVQFLHIAGPGEFESVQQAYKGSEVSCHVADFCSDIEWAYAASDLVICRSGASSLTELSVVGLPAILIPYPFSAEDHQIRNAEVFTSKDACVMVLEKDLQPLELAKMVAGLGTDKDRLGEMSNRMRQLAPANAAEALLT